MLANKLTPPPSRGGVFVWARVVLVAAVVVAVVFGLRGRGVDREPRRFDVAESQRVQRLEELRQQMNAAESAIGRAKKALLQRRKQIRNDRLLSPPASRSQRK